MVIYATKVGQFEDVCIVRTICEFFKSVLIYKLLEIESLLNTDTATDDFWVKQTWIKPYLSTLLRL